MWTLANERVSQRSTHRSTYTDAPALDPTTEEALAGWKAQPRTTPGGQRHYSDPAIETALTLRAVFRLALRRSEGLIGSIMRMLDIDLPVPDHIPRSRDNPKILGRHDAEIVGDRIA